MAVFYNQATLHYAGGAITSNMASGEVLEVLTMTKTPVSSGYSPGDAAAFVISIVNSGDTPVSDLTLTDDLGGYLLDQKTVYPLSYAAGTMKIYSDGTLEPLAPQIEDGPPLTVTGLTVPAQGNLLLIYETETTAYAPLNTGAEITNTATLEGGCLPAPLTASASLPLRSEPVLSISKSISPAVVSGCEPVTYTFLIQNSGVSAAGAEAAIVLSDTFDPVPADLSAELGGAAFTAFTYDAASGLFETTAGAITVPPATVTQAQDGTWIVTPGTTELTVTGTL